MILQNIYYTQCKPVLSVALQTIRGALISGLVPGWCCDEQTQRWSLVVPSPWCSYPCVISYPWVWAGSVTCFYPCYNKGEETAFLWFVMYARLCLTLQPASKKPTVMFELPRRGPLIKNCRQDGKTENLSPIAASDLTLPTICVSWTWTLPQSYLQMSHSLANTSIAAQRDPEADDPSTLCPDSSPAEAVGWNVHCF